MEFISLGTSSTFYFSVFHLRVLSGNVRNKYLNGCDYRCTNQRARKWHGCRLVNKLTASQFSQSEASPSSAILGWDKMMSFWQPGLKESQQLKPGWSGACPFSVGEVPVQCSHCPFEVFPIGLYCKTGTV